METPKAGASVSWLDSPGYRDAAAYGFLALVFSMVAAAAGLLRTWPQDTWIRALGTWMSSVMTGMIVGLMLWEPLVPAHPAPFLCAVISASWLGHRVIDRLAMRVLGSALFDPLERGKSRERPPEAP